MVCLHLFVFMCRFSLCLTFVSPHRGQTTVFLKYTLSYARLYTTRSNPNFISPNFFVKVWTIFFSLGLDLF